MTLPHKTRRNTPIRARTIRATLLLLAAAACESGVTGVGRGGPLPWPAALAEAALNSRQNYDRVSERPIVNVATATGLEHYTDALSRVPGAIDRDERPRYVLRNELFKFDGTDLAALEVPVEEPPPAPVDPRGVLHDSEPAQYLLIGPYTLALDAVEVDMETRKVAMFSVWASTVPYYAEYKHGELKILRWKPGRPVIQYRIEGHWDGRWWVTEVVTRNVWVLPEYRIGGIRRLPELHVPDFMTPEEPGNIPDFFIAPGESGR